MKKMMKLLEYIQKFIFKQYAITDEIECEYWICNNTYSRCDEFWLCKDGTDEINCPPSKCPEYYQNWIFSNDTSKVSCLSITLVGNDIIDCLGETDEQGNNNHSYSYITVFEYLFRCWNETKFIF